MDYFRCDRSVEELAAAWNRTGPYRWEIHESHDRGDYLRAMVGGNKVRVYHDPPIYEIDVLTPVGTSKEQEFAERLALNDVFRKVLLPSVRGTEEKS